jgi:acetyl esterase/lipase
LLKKASASATKLANIAFPTSSGQSELLDVYLPRRPAPTGGWPVLLAIHGGGWRRFDKAEYGQRIAARFVPAGYAVVAPNYELSAPGRPSWPESFQDVQAAVRWVRTTASAFGFNPEEIAAIGESAGANLATLLGTYSPDSSYGVSSGVQAVVAFSTPADLVRLDAESRWAGLSVAQFLGGSPTQVYANYTAASPIDHVSAGDPPMFLVHGLQDSLVPVSQSEELAAALSLAGVSHRLVVVRGSHDLDFPVRYANLLPQILEFLRTTWKD